MSKENSSSRRVRIPKISKAKAVLAAGLGVPLGLAALVAPASAGPPSGYGDTDGGDGGFGGASNDAGFGGDDGSSPDDSSSDDSYSSESYSDSYSSESYSDSYSSESYGTSDHGFGSTDSHDAGSSSPAESYSDSYSSESYGTSDDGFGSVDSYASGNYATDSYDADGEYVTNANSDSDVVRDQPTVAEAPTVAAVDTTSIDDFSYDYPSYDSSSDNSLPSDSSSYDEVGIDVPSAVPEPSDVSVPTEPAFSFTEAVSDFWSSTFGGDAPETPDTDSGSTYDEVGTNVFSSKVIEGTDLDDEISVVDGEYNREVTIRTDGVEDSYFVARIPDRGVEIDGKGGDDRISGTVYDDKLYGGAGNDVIFGLDGNDIIDGGAGADHLYGFAGTDRIDGGAGDDVLYGGDGEDTLSGEGGNDYLSGGLGEDQLDGGVDEDILSGGFGDDVLDGGLGDDVAIGGPGADQVAKSQPTDSDRIYVSAGDEVTPSAQDEVIAFEPVILENVELTGDGPNEKSVLSADLTTLGSIPTSGEMIEEFNETDRTYQVIHIPETVTAVPGAYRPNLDGMRRPDGTPGPGTGSAVWNTYLTNDMAGTNLSVISLGHELAHISNMNRGIEDPGLSVELDAKGQALIDPVTGDVVFTPDTELQVLGRPYDQDGNQAGFPRDVQSPSPADELEENTMRFTDNAIRADLRLPPLQNYNTKVDRRFEEAGLLPADPQFSAPATGDVVTTGDRATNVVGLDFDTGFDELGASQIARAMQNDNSSSIQSPVREQKSTQPEAPSSNAVNQSKSTGIFSRIRSFFSRWF